MIEGRHVLHRGCLLLFETNHHTVEEDMRCSEWIKRVFLPDISVVVLGVKLTIIILSLIHISEPTRRS